MGNEVPLGSASTSLDHGERSEIVVVDSADKCSEGIKQWMPLTVKESWKTTTMLQKVPHIIREIQANSDCYDPLVVSIGPYHHANPKYAVLEKHKPTMARKFANNNLQMLEKLHNKIMEVTEAAKECYEDDEKGTVANFTQEEFTKMMFLDGCFVLQFIECLRQGKVDDLGMKDNIAAFVRRDLVLLENQLPFQVLKELMNLKLEYENDSWSSWLHFFILFIFGSTGEDSKMEAEKAQAANLQSKDDRESIKIEVGEDSKKETGNPQAANPQPAHLLGFAITRVTGKNNDTGSRRIILSPYRSVKELKTAGINFERSKTPDFTGVKFISGFLTSKLILPSLIIDGSTKSMLLNMVAYEACPDSPNDCGVTSYICFLDSLIDHAEDVKELRSMDILVNCLGSDQQVADVFNQIADNLSPNPYAYAEVKRGIRAHHKYKIKCWLSEFWHTHFTSPWTILAFIGAIFALVLSVIQTYESMLPGQREC